MQLVIKIRAPRGLWRRAAAKICAEVADIGSPQRTSSSTAATSRFQTSGENGGTLVSVCADPKPQQAEVVTVKSAHLEQSSTTTLLSRAITGAKTISHSMCVSPCSLHTPLCKPLGWCWFPRSQASFFTVSLLRSPAGPKRCIFNGLNSCSNQR